MIGFMAQLPLCDFLAILQKESFWGGVGFDYIEPYVDGLIFETQPIVQISFPSLHLA